jgi:hypothetical protein
MDTQSSTKNGASKPRTKADFIRSQPASTTAKDVVDAAKKAGIKVTVNHVYNVRAAAKKQRGNGSARAGRAANGATFARLKPGPKPGARSAAAGADLEGQLRRAIAQIGLQRAREIFDRVESIFADS